MAVSVPGFSAPCPAVFQTDCTILYYHQQWRFLIYHILALTLLSSVFLSLAILLGGLPGGSVVKNLPANAGDIGSIPGSGRSPGEEMPFLGYNPWGPERVGHSLATK